MIDVAIYFNRYW